MTHPEFEAARDAVDQGDLDALGALLRTHPDLATARYETDEEPYAGYFHGATLLHHVAGNPQRGPISPRAVEVARLLLDHGAEVDAGCGGGPTQRYSGGGTTLELVASGCLAEEAGVALPLIDLLLERGASLDPGGNGRLMWICLYHVVEHRGLREVGEGLAKRGAPLDLNYAAAVGDLERARGYFDDSGAVKADADALYRHQRGYGSDATTDTGGSPQEVLDDALLFACAHARAEIAEFLIDRGADLHASRRWGPATVTPAHIVGWAGWPEMADWMIARGADLTVRDPDHFSTPAGWAEHCHRPETLARLIQDPTRLDALDCLCFGFEEQVKAIVEERGPDFAIGVAPAGVLLRNAAHLGKLELVEWLLGRGANPDLANPSGLTALDAAREAGHDAVVRRLADARGQRP